MRTPDAAPMRASRHLPVVRRLLLLVVGPIALLSGVAPALGQVDYTGVPPITAPPDAYVVDTYVNTYAGTSPGAVTLVGAGPRPSASQVGSGGTISVANAALGEAPRVDEVDRRLVTGWDVLTIAALGLTAVVAFAVAAARFRS